MGSPCILAAYICCDMLAGVCAAAMFMGAIRYGSKTASSSPENGSVSGEDKYAQYVQIVGTKTGRPPRPAIVRGRRGPSQNLATRCSRESSALY